MAESVEGEIREIAKLFRAKIIGEVSEVAGGALGAAQLGKIYQARMAELRGKWALDPDQLAT